MIGDTSPQLSEPDILGCARALDVIEGADFVTDLREYRCTCGKLLFKGLTLGGLLEIKCRRCGSLERFTFAPRDEPLAAGPIEIDLS